MISCELGRPRLEVAPERYAGDCSPESPASSPVDSRGPSGPDSSPASIRDRILVNRCLQGEEQAWADLVKAYGRLVLNHSYRFTGRRDLAEDLAQEIFLRAYQNLESFRSDSASFRTWLFRVSRNLLIDYHRKERRFSVTSLDENSDNLGIPDDRSLGPLRIMEQSEAARILKDGLMALAPELRQAVILRELEGLSYREIALSAGTAEGTIKSRVSRGRLQLAKLLVRRQLRRSRTLPHPYGLVCGQLEGMTPAIQGA